MRTGTLNMAACLTASLAALLVAQLQAQETASTGLREAAPASVGMDADKLHAIDQRVHEFVDQHQAAGVVTLVARQGAIVHHAAVGKADLAADQEMARDAVFGIASMTKPITAAGIMILVDEGTLSVDDPVAKYLPAFKDVVVASGEPPRQEITIRHLMTHTSGLGGSQQNEGTLAATVEQLAKRPLEFEPGTKWQYGPGLTVCGRIIEVVAGQPYEQFLAQRIFEPLGMTDTTFFPDEAQQKRIARLYQPASSGEGLEPAEHWLLDLSDRTPNPSGGLFSTATDMARFYQMILNGGTWNGQQIVSNGSVKAMTSVQTESLTTGFTPGNGWGLGWCVVREPQGVTKMLSPGTFGHGGAFGTQGWVDPQRQMILVLLVQRTNFGNSDGSQLRAVFQQAAIDALRAE